MSQCTSSEKSVKKNSAQYSQMICHCQDDYVVLTVEHTLLPLTEVAAGPDGVLHSPAVLVVAVG